MKFRRNKKGFTMVELIIVIAVIAVLTAILVPTFIHLTNKAGDASDKTIVKNANTQLVLKAAEGRRNTSMSEAVKDVDEIGYHMSGVSTSNGNQICWDRLNDRFVLFNKDNQIILADGERTQPATAEEFADFFKPVSNFADAGQFTPYAKPDFNFGDSGVSLSEGTLALGAKSFDVGELEGVTVVNVNDASATGTYLVGTGNTSVKVNVNVPNGTVYHLGVSGEVNITGIKGDSYHEFGRVGFAEMNSNGRYVAEKGAEVKALWFSNADAKYTKESGATVNEYAPTTAIKAAIEAQLTNDDVIVSDNKDDVKSDAVEAITEEINKEEGIVTPTDPYKALVEQIESDPRAATATYAAVIDGETNYVFDNLPEAVVGKTITIIMLSNSSRDYTYVMNSRFILDANGHDITFTGDSVGVANNAVMTFRDNKGTGRFIGSDIGLFGNAIVYIESGNFYLDKSADGAQGYIWGYGGTVVITGGSFNFSLNTSWYDTNAYTVVNRDGRYYVEAK